MVKNAKWDKEDGYFVPRDCYNSYFYKSEDDNINLIDKLLEGLTLLPKTKQGKMKLGIYMNRDVYTGLTTLSRRQNSNVVTWQQANNAFGTEGAWATFQGIPLRQVDELTNDEKQVK